MLVAAANQSIIKMKAKTEGNTMGLTSLQAKIKVLEALRIRCVGAAERGEIR